MKDYIVKCPQCNREFWGEDYADCMSMINAHISVGSCDRERKAKEEGDKNELL